MTASNGEQLRRERGPRSAAALTALALLGLLLFVGFLALGTWQVERRAWKLDLIERVDRRVHAQPVAAPGPEDWAQVSAAKDEYRRVSVTGTFQHDAEALVQASTERGAGFWVLTPLLQADGTRVLVNRGFVPPEDRSRSVREAGEPKGITTVTGLLRVTEPAGGFLRKNDPTTDRWYSRDVQAIASARKLSRVAPYFIDAPASAKVVPHQPTGGLTVIAFHNNHMVYMLTWYGLAALVLVAAWIIAREEKRLRRRAAQAGGRGHGQSVDAQSP